MLSNILNIYINKVCIVIFKRYYVFIKNSTMYSVRASVCGVLFSYIIVIIISFKALTKELSHLKLQK